VIKLRFRTRDISGSDQSFGATPWATFSMSAMRSFAEQIGAVINATEAWEHGQHTPSIDTAGVEAKLVPSDADPERRTGSGREIAQSLSVLE
jgi:hypothetical protein